MILLVNGESLGSERVKLKSVVAFFKFALQIFWSSSWGSQGHQQAPVTSDIASYLNVFTGYKLVKISGKKSGYNKNALRKQINK